MLLSMEAAMLSNRLDALLKESEEQFPPASSLDVRPVEPQNGHAKSASSWFELYGFNKYAFVDAATAAGGGMPPPGMDPAMMGGAPPGAPPMDPAMMGGDPAAMGGAPP